MTGIGYFRDIHVGKFNELPSAHCAVELQCDGELSVLTGRGGDTSRLLVSPLLQRCLLMQTERSCHCEI